MTSDVLKRIWPEWEIEGNPLGKGSFGVVYKAVRSDFNVKSYAAIKVISIPSDPSEVDSLRSEGLDISATKTYLRGIVDDFVNEIQLMESLKGVQNIVSVEDYKVVEKTGEIGWDIFIRMELLSTFNAYICDKKLTEEEVIKLGCDICTALEMCGQRNIIHRDIKPENIFINDFGYFKLGDFGIARKLENMTGGLSQKGTVNYMAPEVATGNKYDSRVDTYSLGIVLYRLLNGNRLPFLDTEKQLLNPNERKNAVDRRLRGEALPAPCDASPAMADVILRACAHNPNLRFSSATEMKQALMSVANGTYSPAETGDLDATVLIHGTSAVFGQQADQSVNTVKLTGDPNGAISVSGATVSNQQADWKVNTFGPVQDDDANKRKKLKMIIAIATSACAACAALILAIVLLPKVLNRPALEVANGDISSSLEESEMPVSTDSDSGSSSVPALSSTTTTTSSSSAPVSSSTTTTTSSSSKSSSSSTSTTTSSSSKPSSSRTTATTSSSSKPASSSTTTTTSSKTPVTPPTPVETTVTIWGKEYDIATTTELELTCESFADSKEIDNNTLKNIGKLKNLKKLTLGNWYTKMHNLTSLEGIENLQNLEELVCFSGSNLCDITSIANLTKLTKLSLGGGWHSITDISPLAKLTNLTELDLSAGETLTTIKDLTPLAGLTKLKKLYLVGSAPYDITPLAKLTNLTELNLRCNKISDITPLAKLTNLTELDLGANKISNITPLAKLTKLETLDLCNNEINDITPLANLTKLSELNLEDNKISDITPLSKLTNLTSLVLENNKISDVTPLATLTKLTYLNLSDNQISDITPLSKLTNLTSLVLENNQISDITPLSKLTNLTSLVLENNKISDVPPLATLTKLTYLNLSDNQISDITPLSKLTNLTSLVLENNQISDITPLSKLTNLMSLVLENNQISDITPLATLTKLTYLILFDNQISSNDVNTLRKSLPNCTIYG